MPTSHVVCVRATWSTPPPSQSAYTPVGPSSRTQTLFPCLAFWIQMLVPFCCSSLSFVPVLLSHCPLSSCFCLISFSLLLLFIWHSGSVCLQGFFLAQKIVCPWWEESWRQSDASCDPCPSVHSCILTYNAALTGLSVQDLSVVWVGCALQAPLLWTTWCFIFIYV